MKVVGSRIRSSPGLEGNLKMIKLSEWKRVFQNFCTVFNRIMDTNNLVNIFKAGPDWPGKRDLHS